MRYCGDFMVVLLAIVLLFHNVQCAIKLTDVTKDLFGGTSTGIPAAFGDFNADNYVDIFVIDDRCLYVLLASRENVYEKRNLTQPTEDQDQLIITGVQPGDFNGDLRMDLLVTKQTSNDDPKVTAEIYWGNGHSVTLDLGENVTFTEQFYGQPFLLDYNGDMLPDIMGETEPGKRVVYEASLSGHFKKEKAFMSKDKPGELCIPHSNAFLDLNGDFTADVMLSTKSGFELWFNEKGTLNYTRTIPFPGNENCDNIGQVSFGDFDQNGVEDMLLPVCDGGDCSRQNIYINRDIGNNWTLLVSHFVAGDWQFIPYKDSYNHSVPITLHVGDYNMDGFPDFMTTLNNKDNGKRAHLLENVPCTSSDCAFFGRTFKNTENELMAKNEGVALATFYDIYEDGNLGVLLASVDPDSKQLVMFALRQTSTEDACFIRIMVVSGWCGSKCASSDKAPSGVNQPGAAVKYKTTGIEGNTQGSCGSQLSQSAYFALQLPYVQFGLGLTPNFVDQVAVGMPTNETLSKAGPLKKEWTQIIPNSQLVVIPHPYEMDNMWILKLFVRPSNSLYFTGASLGGTMVFMAAIAGILHWRERREDMKEKRQDAHKFHFDAM